MDTSKGKLYTALQDEEHFYVVNIERNVSMKTRDGIELRSDVYRPTPKTSGEKFPVLLIRTPYNKNFDLGKYTAVTEKDYFPQRGYIVVVQDTRGRYASQGEFVPFKDDANDGYDAVEWCATIPGSTGTVGTVGQSYMGFAQLALASKRPPHLKAMSVVSGFCWLWDNCAYRQGVLEVDFFVKYYNMLARDYLRKKGKPTEADELFKHFSKVLQENMEKHGFNKPGWEQMAEFATLTHPLDRDFESQIPETKIAQDFESKGVSWISDIMKHPNNDEYWGNLSNVPSQSDTSINNTNIDVPIFHVGSCNIHWYDYFQWTTLNLYQILSKHTSSPQKLWMPTTRGAGEMDFGPASKIYLHDAQLRWFNYWLKGEKNGIMEEKPVRLFVMGEKANFWRDEVTWPPARSQPITYYLQSKGRANTLHGDGFLTTSPLSPSAGNEFDEYIYDPLNPVPTHGGCIIDTEREMGVRDQRKIESREDVLVYTSDPLDKALEVTGKVVATIWASSSAKDTDWTAKLICVHKDGYARNLCDGLAGRIVRARYRNGQPELIEPHKVYSYNIDMWSTCFQFQAGDRIRLEISSSNFPRYDRNHNTGNPLFSDADVCKATQKLYHSEVYMSCVKLPVVHSSNL